MADPLPLEYEFTSDPAPVQAEGTVAGRAFYFRARGEEWEFTVAEKADEDPAGLTEADVATGRAWYRSGVVAGGQFAASWMPRDEAVAVIAECAEAYLRAYAKLYTDSAVFEWPQFNTVRGRSGMEAMARSNWESLKDMDLQLTVSARQIAENNATEFGAFQQSWSDPKGVRMTEFGRYVQTAARQGDNSWRIDHFFGFEDSTRSLPKRP